MPTAQIARGNRGHHRPHSSMRLYMSLHRLRPCPTTPHKQLARHPPSFLSTHTTINPHHKTSNHTLPHTRTSPHTHILLKIRCPPRTLRVRSARKATSPHTNKPLHNMCRIRIHTSG